VGIGTCLEYEQSSAPLREDHPLRPATVYGAAKAALYLAVSAWAQQTETEFAWLRLFHLYGPREDPRRLVANVMTSLLAGQRIATTAGDQLRDYLHVDDVGDAIAAVALSTICGEVNVGSGQPVAVRDLVATIGEAVGRADLIDVGARAPRPGDPPSLVADVTRLSTDVGWTPRLALRDGIKQTLEWWRVQHAKEPSSILVRDEF
jgi:nucleoside-diphosphate-sugar epimerase